jgi:3-oxoacyl-[acyl-carrier protein] reductase
MNILITGASKGIGKALAISFCQKDNHKLFLISRNLKQLEDLKILCMSINPCCKVFIYCFDLNNNEGFSELVKSIFREAGKIDLLINNAGMLINKKFHDISKNEIESIFQVNFFAAASLIRLLLPALSKAQNALVINIGSMGGYQGSSKFPGLAYYCASKAAIGILTECLAEEYKSTGIIFTCLALGAVQTEMFSAAFPGTHAQVSPEKMADYIVKFSMTSNPSLNGKIIPVTINELG